VAPLDRSPRLGSGVTLQPHAGAFGAIALGDGVLVQPGCIAMQSVPAGTALVPRRLRIRDRESVERVRALAQASRASPAEPQLHD
jgi:serine acetyltransferase